MQKLYKEYQFIKETSEQNVIRKAQERLRRNIADQEMRVDIERRHQEFLFLHQVARNREFKEGFEQGIAEGRSKIANARKMKEKGYSVKDIADITDLSAEAIEKL
jgi:predicted transposase/invertase (TIGR01784 family)